MKPGDSNLSSALAAQFVQAQNYPAIVTPPKQAQPLGPKEVKTFKQTIPAGSATVLQVTGDFIVIVSINQTAAALTTTPLTVSPDQGPALPIYRAGQVIRFEDSFTQLYFQNDPSNGVFIITFWCGFGAYTPPALNVQAARDQFQIVRGDSIGGAVMPAGSAFASGLFQAYGIFQPPTFQRIKIRRISASKNTNTTAGANFRLWFSPQAPQNTPVRGTVWDITTTDTQYTGFIDLPSWQTQGAGAAAFCDLSGLDYDLYNLNFATVTYLYTWITCNTAYTRGASESIVAQISFEIID